jgi:hypothetical protein
MRYRLGRTIMAACRVSGGLFMSERVSERYELRDGSTTFVETKHLEGMAIAGIDELRTHVVENCPGQFILAVNERPNQPLRVGTHTIASDHSASLR